MADLASVMLDVNKPISPPIGNRTPRDKSSSQALSTGKTAHGVFTYSYGITSHEHKQARLDAFRRLGDAYAPSPGKHMPEDVAFYKLMGAYERGVPDRKAGEALADDYERLCHQRATQMPPSKGRNVCNTCLRPFRDGFYKAAVEDAEQAGGISFDVELGAWKVHFARNKEPEGLYGVMGNPKKTSPESSGVDETNDYPDGGYVDYQSHLHNSNGNSDVKMSMRPEQEDQQMAAVPALGVSERTAVAETSARHVMADYDAFLRSNHVVVTPKTTEAEKPELTKSTPVAAQRPASGDVMSDYDEFLRSNHVVVVPAEKQLVVTAPAVVLAGQAAALGGTMASYDELLRSNHVTTIASDKAEMDMDTDEQPSTAAEGEAKEAEDEDMEYVDVSNEEDFDYLCDNHVVIGASARTHSKEVETPPTARPMVDARATAMTSSLSSSATEMSGRTLRRC